MHTCARAYIHMPPALRKLKFGYTLGKVAVKNFNCILHAIMKFVHVLLHCYECAVGVFYKLELRLFSS